MKRKQFNPVLNDKLSLERIKLNLSTVKELVPVSEYYDQLTISIFGRFKKIFETRGRLEAVRDLKCSRLAFTRWLAGKPMSGHVGAPINSRGLPKVLPKDVRANLSRANTYLIKDILTHMTIGRLFKGGKPLDLDPITSPGPDSDKISDSELRRALMRLRVPLGAEAPDEDGVFDWITTAGPNGPSITASLTDLPLFLERLGPLVSVMMPTIQPLLDDLVRWNKQIKLPKLLGLDKYKPTILRKISIKDDRECKSRPFAIFDYWSQTLLKPLHNYLYSLLRKIPEDCTFNQSEGATKLITKYKNKKYYYSYDLTSATDRFPVSLQERVLALMTNPEYAAAWHALMTSEPFTLKGVAEPIIWRQGQPLGAKSSWGMFSLCHHVIVQIAGIRERSRPEYVLLGDDIVLKGAKLARQYKQLMNDLGVSISDHKSHVSKDTFEFAKVWYHKGVNVSGFPIVGLIETNDKLIELASLLVFELPNKGYPVLCCPRTLSDWLSPLTKLWPETPRLAVYRASRVAWITAFMNWLHTGNSDWAKYIAQMAGPVMRANEAHELLSHLTKNKWALEVRKGLAALRAYSWELARKIPDRLAFVDMDDDDLMIVGSSMPNVLQLADHLLKIPLFAALVNESEKQYDSFLDGDFLSTVQALTLKDLEKLKLPPKPQLKGFEPVRQKAYVRALDLLMREMNSNIRILTFTQRDA
ncbi:RNA-dependent RNA polymerase [Ophiocordyceps sinensis mitovirus 1]|nr:RNA-dependent RNA polymerase [Ophiocordyceps sinensis mitovirus 1]